MASLPAPARQGLLAVLGAGDEGPVGGARPFLLAGTGEPKQLPTGGVPVLETSHEGRLFTVGPRSAFQLSRHRLSPHAFLQQLLTGSLLCAEDRFRV